MKRVNIALTNGGMLTLTAWGETVDVSVVADCGYGNPIEAHVTLTKEETQRVSRLLRYA